MRRDLPTALPYGWSHRKIKYAGSYSGNSASNSQDGSISLTANEGVSEDRTDDDDNGSWGSDSIFNGSVEVDEEESVDDTNDTVSITPQPETRAVFHHESLGDKMFLYPVPITETPLEMSPHTWSRFLCFSTIRQHFILDGSSFNPIPDLYEDHCLWINLYRSDGS